MSADTFRDAIARAAEEGYERQFWTPSAAGSDALTNSPWPIMADAILAMPEMQAIKAWLEGDATKVMFQVTVPPAVREWVES